MYKFIVMVRVWYPAGPETVEYTGYEYDRMEEAKKELETAKTERDVIDAWIRQKEEDRPAIIWGGFDGKRERVALKCSSKEEAIRRLDRAFKRLNGNLWIDSLGQEFSITEEG